LPLLHAAVARKSELTDIVLAAEVMEAGSETKPLRGKSFSITGHLSKRREDIVALIVQAGGRFDKSPSFGTTYLITNMDWTAGTENPGQSKKLAAARRGGTKIISESEFLSMLTSGS